MKTKKLLALLLTLVMLVGLLPTFALPALADGEPAAGGSAPTLTINSNIPGAKFTCNVYKATDHTTTAFTVGTSGSNSAPLTDNTVDCYIGRIEASTKKETKNYDRNYSFAGWLITVGDKFYGPVQTIDKTAMTEAFGDSLVFSDNQGIYCSASYISFYGTTTENVTITACFTSKAACSVLTVQSNISGTGLQYDVYNVAADTAPLTYVKAPGFWFLELPKQSNYIYPVDICLKKENFSYNSDLYEFLGFKITVGGSSIGPVMTATAEQINSALEGRFTAANDSKIDAEGAENLLCLHGTVNAKNTNITVEACFKAIPFATYKPTIQIAEADTGKATVEYEWTGEDKEIDGVTYSEYEVTVELNTSYYDITKGNYDLDYYTVGTDPTQHKFDLTHDNYLQVKKRETVNGNNVQTEAGTTFVVDEKGNDLAVAYVDHYYITTTILASSNDPIDLHFRDGWLEMSLVSYKATTIKNAYAFLTFIVREQDYQDFIPQNIIPLVSGMDSAFYLTLTAHGLCYSGNPDSYYSINAYNGQKSPENLIASYTGVDGRLAVRPFGNVLASGVIEFMALELPEIDKLSVELTWRGFEFSETYDVLTAEDIPEVHQLKDYYESSFGMDKRGHEAYTAGEKKTADYEKYVLYSPYRYALRSVYTNELGKLLTSNNYAETLLEAKAALDAAATGAGCDTVLWVYNNRPDKGTTSRPIIAAMPRDKSYSASDAIEATLEAEYPGNWTYTATYSQFGAFVTGITAGGDTDVGNVAYSTGYNSYGSFYYNGKYSEYGVSNYYPSDGDVMCWGNPDPDFTWVWGILRWKLGDAEIERVLNANGIEYESTAFYALGADGLADLFSESKYDKYNEVTWCKYGQFSRTGQLRELEPEDAVISLIRAIGDVSPKSGPAIEAARTAYDALDADAKAKVTNYDVLEAAVAAFEKLTQIVATAETVRNGVMASLASDAEKIGVGSVDGEWKIMALARDGRITADSAIAQNWKLLLDKALAGGKTVTLMTDYARVALALSSLGIDASAYAANSTTYDLTEPNATYSADMLLNQKIFALLALDAKPYTANTAAFVSGLVADALPGGGWNLMGTGSADVDMTAMAIQALAPYYKTDASVKAAVDAGLAALKAAQDPTSGGFYGMGQYNSCSVAQVVVALCSLGVDPAGAAWTVGERYNPITALCQFYDSTEGMMKYTLNASVTDEMSTEQAAYALAAYQRYLDGKDSLYDMSALFIDAAADLATLKTKLKGLNWTLLQADAESAEAVKTAVVRRLTAGFLGGATATVTIADFNAAVAGTEDTPNGTDGSYKATIALAKGEAGAGREEETVTVNGTITATKYKKPSDKDKDKITVTFRLIGAEQAKQDVDLSKNTYLPEYVTWIPTTTYTIDANSTMYDLFTMAMDVAGVESVGAESNYVKTVTAPASLGGYDLSEFSNGTYSGWMYTVNGKHPGVGLKSYVFSDDASVTGSGSATVVWHYINDYRYESSDWYGGSLGDASVWDGWLKAKDSTGGSGGGAAAGEVKKDDKKETSGSTTSDSNTVTADDGSTVTTETEKTVETKTNDDGSVTETVTEKTTTTVTDPDGKVTATETVVETETTTNSVKNDDGSVTETTGTVEKVTETVTGEDGTKQTTVTETEETKQLNTTTGADGKVSGTGTYSAKSTVTVDGKATTAVTEGTVAVSTDDKGTVSEVTTAKTVTTAPDGTKTETVTVITEAEMANGTTGKVVADEAGNTLSAEATVSEKALEAAVKSGEPIAVPVNVNPAADPASAPAVRIHLPEMAEAPERVADMPRVEIEVKRNGPGVVAFQRLPGGATKLVKESRTGSVIVPVDGDCELVIVDNSKRFADVDAASWYSDSVTFVTARSIFNGNGDGTFAPTATMNRAMAAQIIYNLDRNAAAGDGTRFSDVSANDWFSAAVGWAGAQGIINGYDGAYHPLGDITRQDLVKILYYYAKQAGYDVSAGAGVNLADYADGADVADYAQAPMRWAISVGLIGGYEDGTLRPAATATRAEVAAIMQRMIEKAMK